MSPLTDQSRPATAEPAGLRIPRILLAVMALGAGSAEFVGLPALVAEFDVIGVGQWFRYVTAAALVAGGLMLLAHRTRAAGAIVVYAVCFGALLAQSFILHGDVIHTLVPMILSGLIAWTYRRQLGRLASR